MPCPNAMLGRTPSIRRYEVFLPDAHLPAAQPMYVLYHRLRSLESVVAFQSLCVPASAVT